MLCFVFFFVFVVLIPDASFDLRLETIAKNA